MTTTHTPSAAAPTILDDVRAFLRRFVAFTSEDHELVLALWILHTHAFEAAYCTPYIYIRSAEKQSGKTRTLETCQLLAHNSQRVSGVTTSTIFRMIEAMSPSLLIDEVDALWSGAANEDMRGVLNNGYKRGGQIPRTVPAAPDDPTGGVRFFNVFCPKMLAGIDNGQLPDTIADRSISIVLKRKKKDVQVEPLLARKVEPEAAALREKIATWAADHMNKLIALEPKPMETVSDRAWEIAEPLLAVAMMFRGQMKPAREALTRLLAQEDRPLSLQAQVLQQARTIMEEGGMDKITSATLAEAMDMTAKRIGVLLAPYGITPRTIRLGSNTVKGYHRADFADAWDRYL